MASGRAFAVRRPVHVAHDQVSLPQLCHSRHLSARQPQHGGPLPSKSYGPDRYFMFKWNLALQAIAGRGGRETMVGPENAGQVSSVGCCGEVLEVRARRVDGEKYSHRVEFWDEKGKMMGTVDHLFVEIDVDQERPRL